MEHEKEDREHVPELPWLCEITREDKIAWFDQWSD